MSANVKTVEIDNPTQYVNVLLQGNHKKGSLILLPFLDGDSENDYRTPHEIMCSIAIMLISRIINLKLPEWSLDELTPTLWDLIQTKMEATGWRINIASQQYIHDICKNSSKMVSGYWLWQDQDVPKDVIVKSIVHLNIFLWCSPSPC